ncbi:glycosyltransferase family 2 protein [Ruegeria arenilitoris]|uniref:glycosyltransferase family 2 protein n=1 Tax=Ruegeria arenilitoris TaxID=1173585 RepID=UPI0014816BC1|nr:glycosyltransferase family 2 protein [Ruegeria arenilitoris]
MSAPSETGDAPLISVITATWNLMSQGRQDTFRRVIECMARQNCDRSEHIIQDGASTDGTVEFIQDLIADAPRTRLISEPDQGLYDAMNRGVEAARGEYVLFLNSDDSLAADDVLNRAADVLVRRGPDFAYGSTVERGSDGQILKDRRPDPNSVLQRMPFSHNSVFIRSDLFNRLRGHDLGFAVASDYDLVLRMFAGGAKGVDLEMPISEYSSRGASADDARVARDYAMAWYTFINGFESLSRNYTVADCLSWYYQGNMPLSLCRTLQSIDEFPEALRPALRQSLKKARRRAWQFWRKSKASI